MTIIMLQLMNSKCYFTCHKHDMWHFTHKQTCNSSFFFPPLRFFLFYNFETFPFRDQRKLKQNVNRLIYANLCPFHYSYCIILFRNIHVHHISKIVKWIKVLTQKPGHSEYQSKIPNLETMFWWTQWTWSMVIGLNFIYGMHKNINNNGNFDLIISMRLKNFNVDHNYS